MGLGRQDFSGKKLSPQEADAVIADLKKYLLDIADRWLIKGRFHTDMGNGTLPMEAIKIFWQNWHGFVAEINNFHGVAYQRHSAVFQAPSGAAKAFRRPCGRRDDASQAARPYSDRPRTGTQLRTQRR